MQQAAMVIKKWVCLSLIGLISSFSVHAQTYHPGFADLIIFSGSLSDTGNLASIVGDYPEPFYMNRNSNGPITVDIFAGLLGYDAEPSLHLIGLDEGNNFSVTGSTTGGSEITDLPAQIDAYFARTGGVAYPDVLYLVFIGGHDVIQAVTNPDDAVSKQIIDDTLVGLEIGIKRLIDAGATNIYAPGFINIGRAPVMIEAGLAERARELSIRYETKFIKMLDDVEEETGITFFRFSFYNFVEHSIKNGAIFGFENVTDSCLASPDCDFEKFIFMNENFPTTKVHNLIGHAMAMELLHQISSCRQGSWHRAVCD